MSLPPLTTAVTKKVHGPITTVWHTPPPAPATTPDAVLLMPRPVEASISSSLANRRTAPLVAHSTILGPIPVQKADTPPLP
eukprot:scaffold6684_cov104-Isochrysis_galbana.AAC.1